MSDFLKELKGSESVARQGPEQLPPGVSGAGLGTLPET